MIALGKAKFPDTHPKEFRYPIVLDSDSVTEAASHELLTEEAEQEPERYVAPLRVHMEHPNKDGHPDDSDNPTDEN
jgi:hypothetical protein